jgi:hypothetical protein
MQINVIFVSFPRKIMTAIIQQITITNFSREMVSMISVDVGYPDRKSRFNYTACWSELVDLILDGYACTLRTRVWRL